MCNSDGYIYFFFPFQAGIYTAPACQWEGLSHSQEQGCPALTFSLNRHIRLSQSSFHPAHSHELLVLLKTARNWIPENPALVALRGQFLWKKTHLPEHGLRHICHKYTVVSCIRHINALHLWFEGGGDVERWDKPFLWRVHRFPFFTCVACQDSERTNYSMRWASAPYRKRSWWPYSSRSGSKPQHTHRAAAVLLYRPAPLLPAANTLLVDLILVLQAGGDWPFPPLKTICKDTRWRNWRKHFFIIILAVALTIVFLFPAYLASL